MEYTKLKIYTGCIAPLVLFLASGSVALFFMLEDATGYGWLTIVAPLGVGVCVVLLYMALMTPIHQWLMVRELKRGEGPGCLASWGIDQPKTEFYIGPDGMWLNGKSWLWGGSLTLDLLDVELRETKSAESLLFKFSENLGRSPHYFDVEVPVPVNQGEKARGLIKALFEHHIILDKKGMRKESPP